MVRNQLLVQARMVNDSASGRRDRGFDIHWNDTQSSDGLGESVANGGIPAGVGTNDRGLDDPVQRGIGKSTAVAVADPARIVMGLRDKLQDVLSVSQRGQ